MYVCIDIYIWKCMHIILSHYTYTDIDFYHPKYDFILNLVTGVKHEAGNSHSSGASVPTSFTSSSLY